MLQKWRDLITAQQHAPSINTEEHSVSKDYGAQTRDQHSKALIQKAPSDLGKGLLHLHDDNQLVRSERNEFHRYFSESSDDVDSQQAFIQKNTNLVRMTIHPT